MRFVSRLTKITSFCLVSVIYMALMILVIDDACAADTTALEVDIQKFQQQLTAAEKAWLSTIGMVLVGGPKAFPPFHYYDDKGNAGGMASDYIALILKLLGLNLVYRDNLPWPEVLEEAKARRIDIIALAAKTAEREAYLGYSESFLSFPMVIITQKDAPFVGGLEDLHGKQVAFVSKEAVLNWVKRDKIGVIPYMVKTPIDALEAVSLGRAQALIANLASATYLIQKNGLTNLRVAAPTAYGNYPLYIAVREDWPEMVTIINKVLNWIPPQYHSSIRNRWLVVEYDHSMDRSLIVKWVLGIGGLSGMLIVTVLVWNRRLSREIEERKSVEYSLAESELRFRTLFEQAAVGVAQVESATGRFVRINQRYCDILGYSPEEMTGMEFMRITHPEDVQTDLDNIHKLMSGSLREYVVEKRYYRRDGEVVWVKLTVSAMWEPGHTPDYHIAIVEDINDKKQSEAALAESRRRLDTLIGNLPGMAYRCSNDTDWKMEIVSHGSLPLTGYRPEDLIDNDMISYADVIHPEDRESVWKGVQAAIQQNRPFQLVYRILTADGELKWVWEKGLAVQDIMGNPLAIEGFITDITERMVAEKRIKGSLQEKEVLLKEVHHRVKNNMQIIQSLISLQADKLEGRHLKKPLLDAINRIQSMALIHETLYRSKNMAALDIEAYFSKVAEHLIRIYSTPELQVALSMEIEPVEFDMDCCIACGLIINELISNAMKYAFSEKGEYHISVALKKEYDNEALLIVEDNGKGFADPLKLETDNGLGLNIVRLLVEGQLKGKIEVDSSNGTAFHISFPISNHRKSA